MHRVHGSDEKAVPELQSLASLGEPSLRQVRNALAPYWKSWNEAPQKATLVLRRLAKDKIALALMVLECMRTSKVKTNIRHWNPIIFEYSTTEWQRSLELLLSAMETEVQPDMHSFLSILNAANRVNAWQLALDLLQGLSSRQLSADERIYNIAASSCKSHWRVATHLFDEMMMLGLQPDAITYSTVTTCTGNSNSSAWRGALALLKRAQHSIDLDITNFGATIAALETYWEGGGTSCVCIVEKHQNHIRHNGRHVF